MFMFTKNIFETNLSTASFRTEFVYSDQNYLVRKALVAEGWVFIGCAGEDEVLSISKDMNATSCRKVAVSISFTEVTP
jgi:hypothetical protein